MSNKIANLLAILTDIRSQYQQGFSSAQFKRIRIGALKKLAETMSMTYQSALDVCREQFRPEIDGTDQFDTIVYRWLSQDDMNIRKIALKHSIDEKDARDISAFFGSPNQLNVQSEKRIRERQSEITNFQNRAGTEIERLISLKEQARINSSQFDPKSVEDGREKIAVSIVKRRGQPEFRRKLLTVYQGRCAISGTDAVEALEAAHIVPYKGAATNHPTNGLLLRADLHTLLIWA